MLPIKASEVGDEVKIQTTCVTRSIRKHLFIISGVKPSGLGLLSEKPFLVRLTGSVSVICNLEWNFCHVDTDIFLLLKWCKSVVFELQHCMGRARVSILLLISSAVFQGPDSHYGTKGLKKVIHESPTASKTCFVFYSSPGNNNGTSIEDGQIPEIIFYT